MRRWQTVDMIVRSFVAAFIEDAPFQVTLEWRPADPCAVSLIFPPDNRTWLIGRDLLKQGMFSVTGSDGDVVISPQIKDGGPHPFAVMYFRAPTGEAFIEIDRASVLAFLDRTYALIPAGEETVPDEEYDKLLAAS